METENKCIEVIERKGNLYQVNVEEAWRKLTSRQFANEPARGLEEIISNAVDSYPDDVPKEKVKIAIEFTDNSVAVIDWAKECRSIVSIASLRSAGRTSLLMTRKSGNSGLDFAAFSIRPSARGLWLSPRDARVRLSRCPFRSTIPQNLPRFLRGCLMKSFPIQRACVRGLRTRVLPGNACPGSNRGRNIIPIR
jgi:hypothetical protein